MRMPDFLSIVLLTHSSKNILELYITIKNRIFLNGCVSIDTTQSSSEEVFDKKMLFEGRDIDLNIKLSI